MKPQEIVALREVYAECGLERTVDEVAHSPCLPDIERLKERFLPIKPQIEELSTKFNLGVITLSEFAEEVSTMFGVKYSEQDCRHLMLMNRVFQG